MMKNILFYTILFYTILSCNSKKPNTKTIKQSLEIEDSILYKVKTENNDSMEVKYSVEQKSDSSIVKKDSVKLQEISFIEKLKHVDKVKLPFKFHAYLLDSLNMEGNFYNHMYKLLGSDYDSISKINPVYNKVPTIIDLKNESEDFRIHYSLLFFKGKNDSCCNVSKELVFKRLNKINDDIDVFLTITGFKGRNQNYFFGLIINLVTYNIKEEKQIDKKVISMIGYGYENTEYYEGFVIYKDSIVVKGYVYIEPEMHIINKRFYISNTGKINATYKMNVINYE